MMSTLFLDLEVGDSINVGATVRVTLEEKTGRKARLRVVADPAIVVRREKKQP